MESHAQYRKRGELAGRRGLLLGHRSAAGEQLHGASLAFSWVLFPFWVVFLFITALVTLLVLLLLVSSVFSFSLVIQLFLSQPMTSTFCCPPPPHPTRRGRGKRLRGAHLLAGLKPRRGPKEPWQGAVPNAAEEGKKTPETLASPPWGKKSLPPPSCRAREAIFVVHEQQAVA